MTKLMCGSGNGRHAGDTQIGCLLRTAGGKYRGRGAILPLFPEQPGNLCSSFFGGGPLELALAARGWRVHGYDAFGPLVDFWQCALTTPGALADEVERYYPLSREQFYRLQEAQFEFQLERAGAFFAVNRASFSGATMSGGMSPGHPRFTRSCIERLRRFAAPNLTVDRADFRESIPAHPDDLLFCDPPYMTAKKLYGRRGDLHDAFDHGALRELLGDRGRWILCYDDSPQVRRTYEGYSIIPVHWKYGMSRDKASREIVILSDDVAERNRIGTAEATCSRS